MKERLLGSLDLMQPIDSEISKRASELRGLADNAWHSFLRSPAGRKEIDRDSASSKFLDPSQNVTILGQKQYLTSLLHKKEQIVHVVCISLMISSAFSRRLSSCFDVHCPDGNRCSSLCLNSRRSRLQFSGPLFVHEAATAWESIVNDFDLTDCKTTRLAV